MEEKGCKREVFRGNRIIDGLSGNREMGRVWRKGDRTGREKGGGGINGHTL